MNDDDYLDLCPQKGDRTSCGLFSRPQRCDSFIDGSIRCCIPFAGGGTTVRPVRVRYDDE